MHNPKYNGQELDKETGYYYYNARYYDPEISRFTTADNVIDGQYSTQGWNRYMYCHGNPIVYKDPTGHRLDKCTIRPSYSQGPAEEVTLRSIANSVVEIAERGFKKLVNNFSRASLGDNIPQETLERVSPLKKPETTEEKIGDAVGNFATDAIALAPLAKLFKGNGLAKGYHATDPEIANIILDSNKFLPSKKGRMGPGQYVADTPEGAIAEYKFHRGQNVDPSVIEMKYKPGKNLDLRQYQESGLKLTKERANNIAEKSNADSISYKSIRPGGSSNTVIRNNSAQPIRIIRD